MVNKINQSQNREILEYYVKAGEIIAEMFAPYLEVVIHDLQAPEHSIIAIFNNHVTGRKIGDGTSDIGYKKLADKLPDKIVNYNNQSPSGAELKSSSLTLHMKNCSRSGKSSRTMVLVNISKNSLIFANEERSKLKPMEPIISSFLFLMVKDDDFKSAPDGL
jgi:predicted transcriptional regulator YheO